MSLLGGFRYPAPSANSTLSTTIVNINTFKISGLGDAAAIPVCMYSWDPHSKKWCPYEQ